MRYVVVGTSGSGKSTFARALARAADCPHVELDALFWAEEWTVRPTAEFRESVDRATDEPRWVVDGNYSVVRDVVWPKATHIVWLNHGRRVVFFRVLKRTVRRAVLREQLWHGNRESIPRAFFSRDSILLWALTTYGKNRTRYAALREDPRFTRLAWSEITSQSQADAFVERAAIDAIRTNRPADAVSEGSDLPASGNT